ncbi:MULTISPECIES: site-2 protease family protein [Legionella]|uniref:Site-2 protease family protein n=1 Tax=Legionella septentrionalis TaxID=2498109 RepID=A0A3S0XGV9_9GAMM|nr:MULTISPECIES: site-2 protease family protein [Legionella]MCP0914325.1 site-2 protease family protein [Legionella sp. 27cVA30]RUQ89013.1 site-2 protease family protein [Legionella septentrionalis]RUR00320.1 site-2 protease family protein [Legionella septentrionalis]RUR11823.1 site-2 protease family protein [Legionella septentrionalis]RUR17510.1 site-2 protease family protein [Legionella septentrionalis]
MPTLTLIQHIAVWAIPVLLAITLHEAAHAFIANRCGDTTAKMLGRLSINPIRHIDLIGTILVPLLMGVLTQFKFVFGWAKPVPINWNLLRSPRRDMALVAAAGPLTNILMAVIWAGVFKTAALFNPQTSAAVLFFLLTAHAGIIINLLLALLNLLPIPPLDGSRVVASLLPPAAASTYLRVEPFGFLILITLLLTGVLGWILSPLLFWSLSLIKLLFNL